MKIRINYAEIEITVDNYEHGEGETINAYFLGRIHATSREAAIEKFNLYEIERG